MRLPDADCVLVRHGEIGTKSDQVRRRMEGRLADNVSALLADRGVDGEVERRRYRLVVHTAEPGRACEAATDAFGVVSASPATRAEPTLDSMADELARVARHCYEEGPCDGGSFAVRANRAGGPEAHEFSSRDIGEAGGDAVWDAVEAAGYDPAVDLDDPDVAFHVDCRGSVAFVFAEKREGPGGMPLGTQDPLVALVSGGIDSPVAAWRAMKRGCPVVPLYVGLGDFGGVDHQARALSTVEDLSTYAPNYDTRLRFAPAADAVADIADAVEVGRMVVLRRFMFAVAERVARNEGAAGIVTGEVVGQKSSQTAANLAVTSAATDLPVHRPLLTEDKTDLTAVARAIGTFEDSTIRAGCDRLAPEYPETRADRADIEAREPDDLFERAAAVADAVELLDRE
ncbi:MAG: tRNA sulfurtransferase [Haloarculaceae archaeon]